MFELHHVTGYLIDNDAQWYNQTSAGIPLHIARLLQNMCFTVFEQTRAFAVNGQYIFPFLI